MRGNSQIQKSHPHFSIRKTQESFDESKILINKGKTLIFNILKRPHPGQSKQFPFGPNLLNISFECPPPKVTST
jgi:hypothetical protein